MDVLKLFASIALRTVGLHPTAIVTWCNKPLLWNISSDSCMW